MMNAFAAYADVVHGGVVSPAMVMKFHVFDVNAMARV
jgi:hypothetical protein